ALGVGVALGTMGGKGKKPSDEPHATPVTPPRKPGRHALLVGVNDYSNPVLTNLLYADSDVEELGRILRTPEANFDSVRVLSTRRGKLAPDAPPTAAHVRQALEQLTADRSPDDVILFAFSGQGLMLEVEDPEGAGPAKLHSCLCPSDVEFGAVEYGSGRGPSVFSIGGLIDDLGRSGA